MPELGSGGNFLFPDGILMWKRFFTGDDNGSDYEMEKPCLISPLVKPETVTQTEQRRRVRRALERNAVSKETAAPHTAAVCQH